ncbi:gustatory and odorant receptor 22 isoform X2 [Leptinotarsa decemlineata]|uniref:gustatory and odorant receptor 22 isoform X2 n=1 Tax=Leptinotarsa decemlineata TaxID=7539 RepID=UPI003D305FC3
MHGFDSFNRKNPHQLRCIPHNLLPQQKILVTGTPAFKTVNQIDPEVLHQYDNFYHTTKSLLVLFQIMGVMPIEREVGRTTYRWLSPTNLWAYFIFTIETILVSIVFKERLKLVLLPGKRFDEYIYAIIFLSILIPHFLLPIGAWTNGSEVAKFKNMWTKFQYKYFTVTGTPVVFRNLSAITISLCIVSWIVGIVIMLAQYYLQPDMLLWHTFGYYHILAMLNCLCCLWFINCTAKGRVAGWLAENLHNALQSTDPASKLAEYRDLWVDLSHMMQQLAAVDNRTRQEVNMFLTAIDKNPPIMNLNGYANINRKLISSTVTSMATYLVMLMQFRLSLMRNVSIALKRATQGAAVNSTPFENTTIS